VSRQLWLPTNRVLCRPARTESEGQGAQACHVACHSSVLSSVDRTTRQSSSWPIAEGRSPCTLYAFKEGTLVTTTTATEYAARLENGVKTYGEGDAVVHALNGATAEFERGRFTAIMGPSGSGKSTLLHCIAGLDSLTSGSAYIGDVDLSTLKDKELTLLRRERIGFVFQAFNLVPSLTAEENILLPLSIGGKKPDEDWYSQILDTVGLRDRLSHLPSELSGGQQQRVAAARALASKPEIIFADEPSGNLDSKAGAELLGFMRRAVKEFGQTIVMVTHDPNTAAYSDRIIFLEDGVTVDEMIEPTADSVLDRLKSLGG